MNFGNTDIPKYRRFSVYRKFWYVGITKKVIPIWVSIPIFLVYRYTEHPYTTPENYINPCDTSFEFSEILPLDVHRILSMTKTSKATGHDRISPKLLKDCADIVAESLTVIFNKSIGMGVISDDIKVACVSPIRKSGSKSESSNYRPI